ncbi:adhesion G-protein coupled receptor G5-like isoform X2 [Mastacembelus armatus]|uniref:adhesion G-protein coupled receptor G5-like isoform X2 n=1 Tax=Mastacembelus armatus TaxID=205130 RepID=UPI000E459692|nr:adhesion G-protein coupled receptor G5-like isoform X2 [Mastacembelus armatus]
MYVKVPRLTAGLIVFLLIIVLSTGSSENDWDLNFCGTWRHAKGNLNLIVSLSTGCERISISAGKNTLSIKGKITAHCKRSDLIPLDSFGLSLEEESKFCLYWEPLLDQLKLQVGEKNLTLCWPSSLHGSCCTDLSYGANEPEATYGITNGTIKTDVITGKTYTGYNFSGQSIECKTLCDQASNFNGNMNIQYPCARSTEVEMKADFRGYNIKSPVTKGVSAEPTAIVHLPRALKQAAKNTSKVVVTFFTNNVLFQEGHKEVRILNNVVGITIENEIIAGLSEQIKIDFHHDAISKMHSRKCVSWDTRKDPLSVTWTVDGCETKQRGSEHTECSCNHLTYFAVLVQLQPKPVRHLLALSVITSLGCAVSVISCVALIVFLCRKRRSKEHSIPIHLGLALSLVFLNLLFFFTGVLANVGGHSVCTWVGAALHYSLLSSFTWMGIQVFHTFWLVYIVFRPSPKPYVWNLVGFVLPAVPVIILAGVGGIYGVREVVQSTNDSSPYLMCWMEKTDTALLAHYFTNIMILIVLVFSGIVMLFLVYREIRTRDEWRNNRVAFLSIWGLSCLFGTTWSLTFLDFGPLSDFVLFLSCILNSFQGFLLMLRYCMLDWMRKQAGGSALGSSSTGSTRQQMLQTHEKS